MKISTNEIKTGMIIEHNNDLWEVLKTQHVKPGKGGAFNQVELKSIKKNTKLNERFRSNDTIEKAILDEKKYNFLFEDNENYQVDSTAPYAEAVTNFKYEEAKNDLKRPIRIMQFQYVSLVVDEFKSLMSSH